VTVQVDADAPTAALTCPGPVQQGAAASAAWTASDPAGSGLAGPPSGSLPLDTSRAGPATVTYTAADVAGNTTPANCTYVVEDQPDRGPEPSPSPSPSATPSPAPGGAVGVPLAIRPAAPRLGRASRVGRDGRVRVALTCAATCSGRVSLHAGGRRIAARRFAASAGRSTLVLRLARRERAALARRHRLAASLRLAPDSGPPSARRVTLRRR